jgi:SAM-dependent methyltransferase
MMSDLTLHRKKLPFPPVDLLQRTGHVGDENPEDAYDKIGIVIRKQIEGMLPPDWSWTGIRVLDFGCGAGRVLRQFQDESRDSEFWGCEIDRLSVDWINANLSPACKAIACNEEPGLPVGDGSFDLIYSISVFTHLTDHSSGWLLELHRTLAPGGLLLASFLGEAMSDVLIGEPWEEDRIGFNAVLYPCALGASVRDR